MLAEDHVLDPAVPQQPEVRREERRVVFRLHADPDLNPVTAARGERAERFDIARQVLRRHAERPGPREVIGRVVRKAQGLQPAPDRGLDVRCLIARGVMAAVGVGVIVRYHVGCPRLFFSSSLYYKNPAEPTVCCPPLPASRLPPATDTLDGASANRYDLR